MGLHADLLRDLQENQDPEKALKRLVNAYPTEDTWTAAMSMWKGVRYSILHDESNRDPSFHLHLQELMKECGRHDQLKLLELNQLPLYEQYKILSVYNQSYLQEDEMDDKLKDLSPCYAYFYEFSFPDEMEEYCRVFREERENAVNMHEWKEKDQYNMNKEEADQIIEISTQTLTLPPVESSKSYFETVAALLVVTGTKILDCITYATEINPLTGVKKLFAWIIIILTIITMIYACYFYPQEEE